MDDFMSRPENKRKAKQYAQCEAENEKGIILDGEATGQKGSATYPTDGEERVLPCPGVNDEDEEMQIEKTYN